MPIALIIEILQGIMALAPEIPGIFNLAKSGVDIAQAGDVTPEQEAEVRAQLDEVKRQIDAA